MKKQTPRTLNVWDIDDTLGETSARVVVTKNGKPHKILNPGEFNKYTLGPDEKFDFSQFRSGKVFRETFKPISSVLDRAKEIISRQKEDSHSIILTARSDFADKDEFLQAFRDHGFPIDKVYVERAGNLAKLKPSSKPHINKGVILKRYMASGKWDRVRMWDDSEQNLNILHKLGKQFPNIETVAYLVKHGKVSKYAPIHEEIKPAKIIKRVISESIRNKKI